jgi:fatty-acyl-CoA synthase
LGLDLDQDDRVAILAHTCLEWMEIDATTANAGLVMVPINFRLVGKEMRYLLEDSEAKALIVHDLIGPVEDIRADLSLAESRYIRFGGAVTPKGYRSYEDLIAVASTRTQDWRGAKGHRLRAA